MNIELEQQRPEPSKREKASFLLSFMFREIIRRLAGRDLNLKNDDKEEKYIKLK